MEESFCFNFPLSFASLGSSCQRGQREQLLDQVSRAVAASQGELQGMVALRGIVAGTQRHLRLRAAPCQHLTEVAQGRQALAHRPPS